MRQNNATLVTVKKCREVLVVLPDSPTKSLVLGALDREAFSELWDGTIPFPCTSRETFPSEYMAYNLLRKFPFQGVDRKKVALAAFAANEEVCFATNRRLKVLYRESVPTRDAIQYLREKIQDVLGPFSWNEAEQHFAWGPGATTRLKNEQGDVYFKFRGKPETTLYNLPLAVAAIGRVPAWFGSLSPMSKRDVATVVAGSKITTVPKDAKTERTIAIEPCMNMYVQKGIGTMIRNRLRREAGVDLNDQSKNQQLASEAQARGLATIDLSSASDTVSSELVELLLPSDWLSAMKRCRSFRYVLSSRVASFEKFSTMGNGYTFELESLIFWAITKLAVAESFVADRVIGVYGDDIICHAYAVPRLVHWLTTFGFSLNVTKSYSSGPFYESCGKHFWNGRDVTPVFVKEPVVQPQRDPWFLNSIIRWGHRNRDIVDLVALRGLWDNFRKAMDPKFTAPIPNGVGDGGLVTPSFLGVELVFPLTKGMMARDYQRGYCFNHYIPVFRRHDDRDPSDVPYLLRALYRMKDHQKSPVGQWMKVEGLNPCLTMSGMETHRWVVSWTSSWDSLS